jgi:hypothetical protein
MEKWSLNKLDIEAVHTELTDDIVRDLKTPVAQRKNFRHNPYVVTIPRYFYRFIGIKSNEEDYYERLYRLDKELIKYGNLYRRYDNGLDKNISLMTQNKLGEIWGKIVPSPEMDTSYLISLMIDNNLMPVLSNTVLLEQVKSYFKGLLDYYVKLNNNELEESIKLIVNYCAHWMQIYIADLFSNFDYIGINPKILFYGDITKEECFFLNLLSTLGCDILYFNPNNSGLFNEVDKYNSFSKEILYSMRRELKPFPEGIRERVKTTAYSAKEELNRTLFSEESSFYRPWQFSDYSIKAITLKTTYEEINLWGKEKAMIRDGWKIENRRVYIPNIFAKINGTHSDIDKYWKEVNEIICQKNAMFYYKKLPIIDVVPLEYGKYEYVFPDEPYSEFDVEKLLRAPWWKYKELRTGLQRTIAEKIRDVCIHPLVMNIGDEDERDFQVDIFSVLINLELPFQQLLQGFDYPEEVPKIIIYNNEKNGNLSYEDCIMLTFMNSMGVDIVIYNPSGYTDIENYIYQELYDIHRLEKVSFNLEYKKYEEKKGFFKSIFG